MLFQFDYVIPSFVIGEDIWMPRVGDELLVEVIGFEYNEETEKNEPKKFTFDAEIAVIQDADGARPMKVLGIRSDAEQYAQFIALGCELGIAPKRSKIVVP